MRRAAPDILLHLLLAVWCTALLPRAAPDLAADRAALLALRDAIGRHLPWNASSSPCSWRGVRCDAARTRVEKLQLPGAGLAGHLPPRTLGNLTALRTLSLRLNALSGGIPADIGACAELRAIYLQGNRLDGEIPETLFQLNFLQRLDLSRNRVAGGVSPEFNKLRRLATLYLQNNSLNGTLPADFHLPKLEQFNVSNNDDVTGSVPASLAGMPASAFTGTRLCGAPLLSPCPNPPAPPSPSPSPLPTPPAPAAPEGNKSSKLSAGAIAGIAAGSAAVLLAAIAVILFLLCFRRRRQRGSANSKSAETSTDVDVSGSPPVSVTVASLTKTGDTTKRSRSRSRSSRQTAAAGNKKLVFVGGAPPDPPYDLEALLQSSAEILGKGWLGTTYRATLEGGAAALAVKRLREAPIPEREFRDAAAALGALRHDNLATLRAYFYSREEKLLVYDLVPGARSLCALLHGGSPARLDFTARAQIALAAARGVAHLHAAGARSCHGNIKSSNVLVPDAAFDRSVVTDHGLLQLVGAHVPLKRVTGYRAPELVADPKKASREADVYSFGVLLLEMLTGRPPARLVSGSDGGDVDLPRWVRDVVREEWTAEVFDASIAIGERVEEEMVTLLRLAVDCTEQRPDRRPGMDEVTGKVEGIVESAVRKAHDVDDDDDFHSISP